MWTTISRRSFVAAASALIAWPATREVFAEESGCDHLFWNEPEPNRGESCFAIAMVTPPANWRPQSAAAIPPQWRLIVLHWPSRNLAPVARDVLNFNNSKIEERVDGETLDYWAVAVSMIYPIDETARPIVIGGAT
jgi:hypothetical protein